MQNERFEEDCGTLLTEPRVVVREADGKIVFTVQQGDEGEREQPAVTQ